MTEEKVDIVVAVPVALKHSGYLALNKLVVEGLGMSDIVVIGDSTILSHLLMIHREHGMHLIAVAVVGTEQGGSEMRRTLVGIISAGIGVVDVETKSETLVGIGGKQYVYMVLSIEFVAAVVVCYIGDRRKRVGEQNFIGLLHHMRIRLHEQELTRERLVDSYSAQSRSVVITRGVIFPILASIEYGVHKEMGHSVGQRGDDVAKFAVYLPHSQSFGYFLVARGVVVMLVEITVCSIAVDVHAIYVSGIVSPLEILGSGTHK